MLQDGGVEGHAIIFSCECHENPINSMTMHKDMTLKDKLPRLVGAQYATGEEQRNYNKLA